VVSSYLPFAASTFFFPRAVEVRSQNHVFYRLLCHISAGGGTWTFFASPPIQQEFFYSTPVRVFGSSFGYPEIRYDTWGQAWDKAPTDITTSIKTDTPQNYASTEQHKRSKRFAQYWYGGMPGMMMGGYGTGMASAAAASAVGTNSYGSYGYPFFG